jgi:hypothetical protein
VELAAEQPALVEALSDRLGELAVVGYHRNAWTQAPPQMQIERGTAQLQAFTSDEPATVILIGHDRRRVTLRVISPLRPPRLSPDRNSAPRRKTSAIPLRRTTGPNKSSPDR